MSELETLTAFRAWVLNDDRTRLCSWGCYPGRHLEWEPGVNEARCELSIYGRSVSPEQHNHRAPTEICGCGLYALHYLDEVASIAFPILKLADNYCIGIVQAWGKTLVHREGIRAEFMRPIALCHGHIPFVPRESSSCVGEIDLQTPQIGLPIINLAHGVDFAKEHGTLSETLLSEVTAN